VYPVFGKIESNTYFQHCSRLNPRFYQGWLFSLFLGPICDLVYALKHDNARWVLIDLSGVSEYAEVWVSILNTLFWFPFLYTPENYESVDIIRAS